MKSILFALLACILALSVMLVIKISGRSSAAVLPEGPKGGIEDLREEQFYVDGSAGSGRVFTFSNGTRSLCFIPMIHQGEPAFYEAVAGEVKHLKAQGMDLYYEFIDFDSASDQDKRRIRALLGFLPTPAFYADNVSKGMVAQDNAVFLGFPGGEDVNVDVTPAELADAYEELVGPLPISEENRTAPLDTFVAPTAEIAQISRVTIDWRNRHLARAIHQANRDVVVLYGAAHGAGMLRELRALDSRWQRVDSSSAT